MFASDYPLLTHGCCLREAALLPFRDERIFRRFVSDNASAMFFDRATG